MKKALVIHPRFTLYGGGEVVGLHVCKVLQELGYGVYLACDNFDPDEADRHLGLGEVMRRCTYLPILGEFKPFLSSRFLAYQRAIYTVRLLNSIRVPRDCDFVFSTQSVFFFKPDLFNFCVAYDLADFLYAYEITSQKRSLRRLYYYPLQRLYRRYASRASQKKNFFIPLSHAIEESMKTFNYPHSPTVFPPCDMSFRRLPKEKYAVNTSRLVPSKRLEDFIEVARRLPQYNFVIIGKMSETEAALFPDYKQRLTRSLPPNAKLVEALLMDHKEVVERAKVYLYPSIETGISVSLGQAMGAGCIPVTPSIGGGAEMLDASGLGYKYRTLEEAVDIVRLALESQAPNDRPEFISDNAQIFSANSFDNKIREIVSEKMAQILS